jgi:predicted anti-sigma-YlaC factor YlaD
MLSCEVITDLMAAYESGEASAETRRLVDEHLAGCASCRAAFSKNARVDSALSRATAAREEKPVNGQQFVSRTRRLFFFVGVGVLLFFSVHAAIVMRVFANAFGRGTNGTPIGSTPGWPYGLFPASPGVTLAVAAAAAIAYIALALSPSRGSRGSARGGVARAIAGGVLLTLLALTTLYIWVAGPVGPGLIAAFLLIAALVVTATRLAKLPYFTIVAIASLIVAIAVLLNLALVSRIAGRF